MPEPARRLTRRIVSVAVVAMLITVSTESIATARASQPVPVATLSIAGDLQGSDGLPPDLGILVPTALLLGVNERACGGPNFVVGFDGTLPSGVGGEDADQVTVLDADINRVDVEVPTEVDGTDCEYTFDVLGPGDGWSLLCYQTVDVVADGPDGEQTLNLAGYETGEAVSPTTGDVVAVMATYIDRCSEIRLDLAGEGYGDVFVTMAAEPVDPADRSVSCDFGNIGPQPLRLRLASESLEAVTAGCVATLVVTVEACTITPTPDRFVIVHPVTIRRLSATCAPAAPVPAEPAFTG